MTLPNRKLFVTGTDTNVGKTHVSCLIARQWLSRGKSVAIYKPACSGAIAPTVNTDHPGRESMPTWDDIERIKSVVGQKWPDDVICPQRYFAPLAPPVAARKEGRKVDFGLLVHGADAFSGVDLLLIEGAGGWLSPVTETQTVADLAEALRAPVLIVARAGLGTINQTLLTIESIRARGLKPVGVVLNEVSSQTDESNQTNADQIESFSGVPVFGTVRHGDELEIQQGRMSVAVNWELLATA